MNLYTDVNFFDKVYLIDDPQQIPRSVTEMIVCPGRGNIFVILYKLTSVTFVSTHYRQEFSFEKDQVQIISSNG